ncbi:MAG: hypothetical protein MUF85_01350 [Patescibacteria group bacterium]|jgi:hypothetical protein|nr:hypothetical protein [Patescibacteria group bacterium]
MKIINRNNLSLTYTFVVIVVVYSLFFGFNNNATAAGEYGCPTDSRSSQCIAQVEACFRKETKLVDQRKCAEKVVKDNSGSYDGTRPVIDAESTNPLAPPTNQIGVYRGDLDGDHPIILWIQFFMNWLTVLIVAGSTVMVAYAGVRYILARDDAGGVKAAKEQIGNVVIGLLTYFFLYAFLQWLVPGGVF